MYQPSGANPYGADPYAGSAAPQQYYDPYSNTGNGAIPHAQQQQQAAVNEAYHGYEAATQQQQQQQFAGGYGDAMTQEQQQQPTASGDVTGAAPGESIAHWSFSMFPTNRLDGARLVAPLGCLYTPLGVECPSVGYEPVTCTKCGGVLNPYARPELGSRQWNCPLCLSRNPLPPQYGQISEYQLPLEMQQGVDTIEYVTPMPARQPPTFVFVVDTCVDTEEEFAGLKEYLHLVVEQLPEYALVAFITYGTTVQLHEIPATLTHPRSLVFRGSQEVTVDTLKSVLNDEAKMRRFVGPSADRVETLRALIDGMQRDFWPIPKDHRPMRCNGAAISAAASLLALTSPNVGSSIMAFLSGVCTVGPGTVVETSREQMIRVHTDIRDATSSAAYWATSCTFYDQLMQRIVAQGHSLNCFTAALDQLGIAEMKLCIQSSGGVVLNAESWLQLPFKLSLRSLFARREDGALCLGLNATLDVVTSPSWKVQGVIGPCVGTGKKSPSVADYDIGIGGTCQWTTSQLDATSTFAVYFDAAPNAPSASQCPLRYTQLIMRYEVGRERRTRVTTLVHRQQDNPPIQDVIAAFDQEAAVVLLARQAVHKTDSMPVFDVLRWLDRTLVRLVSRFGQYTKDQPSSLRLPPEFVFFPAFVYHLRRSGFLQVFNYSPDESAILRLQFLKSTLADSIVQIQPTLYCYRMDAAPQPVPLDSTAIQPDNILLLDTFFEVLIHYGSTIAAWKTAGYAEQEEYSYFRDFLEVAMADAQILVGSRFPTPRLIDVCQDDPDARILYNRINPARSYADADAQSYGQQEGELVNTDEASLQVFMDHLKKLAVSQN